MLKINPARVRGIADELDSHGGRPHMFIMDFKNSVANATPQVIKDGSRPDCATLAYRAGDEAQEMCMEYKKAVRALAESIHQAAEEIERQDERNARVVSNQLKAI